MDKPKNTAEPPGRQSTGLDLAAIRRRHARALLRGLYQGYGDVEHGEDGPRRVQVPPLLEIDQRPDAFKAMADRWASSPFPEGRYNKLRKQGYTVDLSPGDRVEVLWRAARREGVRERMRERKSVRPLRNAVTEEATSLVRGAPRPSWEDLEEPGELPEQQTGPAGRFGLAPALVSFWERELIAEHGTPREREVWPLRRAGYSFREIGQQLGISESWANQCYRSLQDKLAEAAVI